MKLAYLAPEFYPPWGGVGIYSTHLIRELSKRMEIDVFTPRRGRDYDSRKIEEYFGARIRIINLGEANDEFIYNIFFQYRINRDFPSYMRKENYDIVHSANLVHMPDIFLKLRGYTMNSVATAHTTIRGQVTGFLNSNKNFFRMAPSEKGSLLAYPYIRTLEKMYLRRTKHMITVSKRFARMFVEEEGYKGRLSTIYNGIDRDIFSYNKVRGCGRFQQLKDKGFIVLFAGRLITQKGIGDFVKMMSLLSHLDIHFAIAGKGDVDGLMRLISVHGIPQSKYTFLGFVDNNDLPWLYKLCKVFVLPSYYENFPISVLEALSMRCLAIATNVGAVDEIIDHGENGLLARPKDPQMLARQVQMMYEDEKKRLELAIAGQKKVLSNFTTEKMADATYKFYKGMV